MGNPFFFTSRQFDPETGFYHYRARAYDPVTGRFLQRDPEGFVDSMNLYEYCTSNPLMSYDPFGMAEFIFPWEKGYKLRMPWTSEYWEHLNSLNDGTTLGKAGYYLTYAAWGTAAAATAWAAILAAPAAIALAETYYTLAITTVVTNPMLMESMIGVVTGLLMYEKTRSIEEGIYAGIFHMAGQFGGGRFFSGSRGGGASSPNTAKGGRPSAFDKSVRRYNERLSRQAEHGGQQPAHGKLKEPDGGVIYLRTDNNTGGQYVGQADSLTRFGARQQEEIRLNPKANYQFDILERPNRGTALDVAEENWIRILGGPSNKTYRGTLENKRVQMNERRYRAAGGLGDLP